MALARSAAVLRFPRRKILNNWTLPERFNTPIGYHYARDCAMELLKSINRVIDKCAGTILFRLLARETACQVIGHRGAPSELPENTIASLMTALSDGADGVEFDIVLSRDCYPFVCHDLDVSDRVPAFQQPAIISNMSATEVAALWIHGSFRIPALKEVLEQLKAVGPKRVYVHYKRENEAQNSSNHVHAVAVAIREANMREVVVVMVESGVVDQWREQAPDLHILQCWTTAYPRPGRGFPIDDALSRGLDHIGLYFTSGDLSRWGRRLKRWGFARLGTYFGFAPIRRLICDYRGQVDTFATFTINDPFLMRVCASAGFDAIGSDDPALLSRVLRKRKGRARPTLQPSSG
jgi:glycerophosphoryl diester phosphodiesterase